MDDPLAWIEMAKSLGIPSGTLLALLWMLSGAARWLAKEFIGPVRDAAVRSIDTIEQQSKTQTELLAAIKATLERTNPAKQ